MESGFCFGVVLVGRGSRTRLRGHRLFAGMTFVSMLSSRGIRHPREGGSPGGIEAR